MISQYDIIYRGEKVGDAFVESSGLYYIFRCKCNMHTDRIYRITISSDCQTLVLGVYLPQKTYGLEKRIPKKKINMNSALHFHISFSSSKECVNLVEGEPVTVLSQLDHYKLDGNVLCKINSITQK